MLILFGLRVFSPLPENFKAFLQTVVKSQFNRTYVTDLHHNAREIHGKYEIYTQGSNYHLHYIFCL